MRLGFWGSGVPLHKVELNETRHNGINIFGHKIFLYIGHLGFSVIFALFYVQFILQKVSDEED